MTNYRVDYLSLGSDGIFFALRNFSLLTYFARSGSTSLDRIVKLSRLIRARKSGCWIVGSRESPNRFRGSVPDTATWIDEIAKHRRGRDILFSLSLSLSLLQMVDRRRDSQFANVNEIIGRMASAASSSPSCRLADRG